MKKFFTLISFVLLTCLSLGVNAQNYEYFREGFDESTLGMPSSATDPANFTGYHFVLPTGAWYFYGAYRTTGTACTGYGAGHIRTLSTSQNLTVDSAKVVTPILDFGVSEIHFSRCRSGRAYGFYYRTDTSAAATTGWTLIKNIESSPNVSSDTGLINLNLPNAKRIMITSVKNSTSTLLNQDFDSIWVKSVNPITTTPIRFNNLNVVNNNGLAKVTFACQDETNVKEYIVERSSNGSAFSAVGRLNSAGTAKYTIMDNAPYAGVSYYRVTAVYADGKSVLSSVVKLSATSKATDLVVAPNPVRGSNLNLQFNNFVKGSYTLNIYNSVSQKVYTKVINHDGGSSLQQLLLPAAVKGGMYNLQLVGESVKITKTLVVE